MTTANLQTIPVQSFYRGETVRWLLPVTEPNGAPKDFTSAVVRWALLGLAGAVVVGEKTVGDGVSFETSDPTTGRVILTMTDEDTDGVAPGGYVQEWHIEDVVGDVQIYRGPVVVASSVLWSAVP